MQTSQPPKPVTLDFAYVYLLYYHDLYEEKFLEKMHQMRPVVYTTLESALLGVPVNRRTSEWITINECQLWRMGNYWVERSAVIDPRNMGLEYERSEGNGKRSITRIPILPAGNS